MTDSSPPAKGGRSPFTDLLGIEFIKLGHGTSHCAMETGSQFHNMKGLLHGGAAFSLIDTAMGAALPEILHENELSVTLEIQVTYLKKVIEGRLACEARVIKRGRRVIFLEAEARQGEDIIAKATGTYAIIEAR